MDRLETKWTPYSERLPEKQDEYMISWRIPSKSKRSFLSIAEYEPEYNNWILDDYISRHNDVEITAWMPLPEPYEA